MVSIVAYGGGTNSTAMLIGMIERGEPAPDAILFADTGGEKPKTYEYVGLFSPWLTARGYPPITFVRVESTTLEADCLRRKALPSIAYGFKTCSQRFKIEPQERWGNNAPACKAAWSRGEKVIRLVGYHADEPWRAENATPDAKYHNRYPLLEWDWGQEDCEREIAAAGLPVPPKSACFFCPSSKPHEIRALARQEPDLMARALEMERNADLTNIVGLGRRFSWADVLAQGEMFPAMYDRTPEQPCGCFDGAAADEA